MKKFYLILFVALGTLITSCSSDDTNSDDPLVDGQSIVGDWKLTDFKTENGTTIGEFEGIPLETTFTSYGKDFDAEITFAENPNTYVSTGGYTTVITSTTLGQSQTQEVPINDFIGTGEWSIDGNKMTITSEEQVQIAEITSLTSEMISLKFNFEEEIMQQGIVFTTSGTILYTLEKQ